MAKQLLIAMLTPTGPTMQSYREYTFVVAYKVVAYKEGKVAYKKDDIVPLAEGSGGNDGGATSRVEHHAAAKGAQWLLGLLGGLLGQYTPNVLNEAISLAL
ncbi:hypothetical protein HaLaN_21090 [Haematococcus lacustris]|uniref:Uncharacterized protein n=1 Tax=Haematococcus lacustris TaxID=44745 RepID=A0A699ZXP7_HAELA|nr:hypothetical protein HaLaN_21090 [Haematococcus lacustris]